MDARQVAIKPLLRGTGTWVDHEALFSGWSSGADRHRYRGLLRITGKPGAGKSALMKDLVRRFEQSRKGEAVILTHFFARGTMQSSTAMFRTLLYYLMKQSPPALEKLSAEYGKNKEQRGEKWSGWDEKELPTLLYTQLLSSSTPTYIFIDALDECEDDQAKEVLDFFRELTDLAFEAGISVNVCFSSRHYPKRVITDCPEIILEDTSKLDMRYYAMTKLSAISGLDDASLGTTVDLLVQQSSGIFLWVEWAVRMLEADWVSGRDIDSMMENVRRLPTEMDTIFANMVQGINPIDQHEALAIFQWLLVAQRPLTLCELRYMASWHQNLPYTSIESWKCAKGDGFQDYRQYLRRLLALSRGLVEVILPANIEGRSNEPVTLPKRRASYPQVSNSTKSTRTPFRDDLYLHVDVKPSDPEPSSLALTYQAATRVERHLRAGSAPRFYTHLWDPTQSGARGDETFGCTVQTLKYARVQFIHATAPEFLLSRGFQLLDPGPEQQTLATAHALVSKCCYACLRTEEVLKLPSHVPQNTWANGNANSVIRDAGDSRIVKYALEYFTYHARIADSGGIALDPLILNDDIRTVDLISLYSDGIISQSPVEKWSGSHLWWWNDPNYGIHITTPWPYSNISMLIFCCHEGLFHSVKYLSSRTKYFYVFDTDGDTPLQKAFCIYTTNDFVRESRMNELPNRWRIFDLLISDGVDVLDFGDHPELRYWRPSPLSMAMHDLPPDHFGKFLHALSPRQLTKEVAVALFLQSIQEERDENTLLLLETSMVCNLLDGELFASAIKAIKHDLTRSHWKYRSNQQKRTVNAVLSCLEEKRRIAIAEGREKERPHESHFKFRTSVVIAFITIEEVIRKVYPNLSHFLFFYVVPGNAIIGLIGYCVRLAMPEEQLSIMCYGMCVLFLWNALLVAFVLPWLCIPGWWKRLLCTTVSLALAYDVSLGRRITWRIWKMRGSESGPQPVNERPI
jgi:hypothetical protein